MIRKNGLNPPKEVWHMLPSRLKPEAGDEKIKPELLSNKTWYMDHISQLDPELQIKVLFSCRPEIAGAAARRLHVSLDELTLPSSSREKALLQKMIADMLVVQLVRAECPSWAAPVLKDPFRCLSLLGEKLLENTGGNETEYHDQIKEMVHSLERSRISFPIRVGLMRMALAAAVDDSAADSIIAGLSRIPALYFLKCFRWTCVCASGMDAQEEKQRIRNDMAGAFG